MAAKHDKQDDDDKYKGNGHDPDRAIPREDPGGKHEKKEEEE